MCHTKNNNNNICFLTIHSKEVNQFQYFFKSKITLIFFLSFIGIINKEITLFQQPLIINRFVILSVLHGIKLFNVSDEIPEVQVKEELIQSEKSE